MMWRDGMSGCSRPSGSRDYLTIWLQTISVNLNINIVVFMNNFYNFVKKKVENKKSGILFAAFFFQGFSFLPSWRCKVGASSTVKYCSNIVQILFKYCSAIVQILYNEPNCSPVENAKWEHRQVSPLQPHPILLQNEKQKFWETWVQSKVLLPPSLQKCFLFVHKRPHCNWVSTLITFQPSLTPTTLFPPKWTQYIKYFPTNFGVDVTLNLSGIWYVSRAHCVNNESNVNKASSWIQPVIDQITHRFIYVNVFCWHTYMSTEYIHRNAM